MLAVESAFQLAVASRSCWVLSMFAGIIGELSDSASPETEIEAMCAFCAVLLVTDAVTLCYIRQAFQKPFYGA